MTVPLEAVIQQIQGTVLKGSRERILYGITPDSRAVRPDWMFVALTGLKGDGCDYIPEAVERGATVVIMERGERFPGELKTRTGEPVTLIQVENGRRAMGLAAAVFYGCPARRLRMIGVTGTNGKTTVTYLVRSLLKAAGRKVGLFGTIEYAVGDRAIPATHTTPESVAIQEGLARMVQAGVQDVVMEVSSHGLYLHRVAGCEFDVGVFTNLTQDHLDFHKTMEEYYTAKTWLFRGLTENLWKNTPKKAVINADDPYGKRLLGHGGIGERLSFGLSPDADVGAEDVRFSKAGLQFLARTPSGDFPVRSSLMGRYNVYNLLAAIGVGCGLGLKPEDMQAGIQELSGVPGRFESVNAGQPFLVIVDYAHTEDALHRLLHAVTELTSGRILTVFGCGGDRDRGKRAPMGRTAARFSDIVLVTSDNPRGEDPVEIIREIEIGVREGAARTKRPVETLTVPDRREAIERALSLARPGDAVVIAGKGHETVQVIGSRTIPFDDRQIAGAFIRTRSSGNRPLGV